MPEVTTFPPAVAITGGGSRAFAIGDSIVAGGYANSGTLANVDINGRAWLAWATLYSDGKIFHAGVSATAGYTTAQILATHVPVAIAAKPSFCVVLGGTNDMLQAIPLATTAANLTAIYNALLGAGVTPVLATIPPRNNPIGNNLLSISQINAWITRYAQNNNLPLVDFHGVLVDPATGQYLSTLFLDDYHPNAAGAKVMGAALQTALSSYLPPFSPFLAEYNSDPSLMMNNALMLTASGGIPTNWVISAGGGSITNPAATAPGVGKLMTVTRTTSSTTGQTSAITLVPGHRVLVAFRVQSTVKALGGVATVRFINAGVTQIFQSLDAWTEDIPAASVWAFEFVVPAGLSSNTLYAQVTAGTIDNSVASIGQFTVVDLTAQGIAA